MSVLDIIKEKNLKEIEEMKDIKPETKQLMVQYVNKFGSLFPKMRMTTYDNEVYIRLMKDAIEEDLPITYEDIENEFRFMHWDVVK